VYIVTNPEFTSKPTPIGRDDLQRQHGKTGAKKANPRRWLEQGSGEYRRRQMSVPIKHPTIFILNSCVVHPNPSRNHRLLCPKPTGAYIPLTDVHHILFPDLLPLLNFTNGQNEERKGK